MRGLTRGQAAMEYLATYGWAILVVMVVGAAMWQMGIFNVGYSTMSSTGFAKIKPQLAGTGLRADGTFTGVFTNGLGERIDVTEVRMNNTGKLLQDSCVGRHSIGGPEITPSNPMTVSIADNFVVYAQDCGTSTFFQETYIINVQITYSLTIGTARTEHREFGSIRGPYER